MQQFGGKDSKRHFTVVMGGKEHGLYVSSTPSSAARKAVTKLCTANKSKKVEFHIREITQGSKKKTYGPYDGYIEKLKEPIELKGRVIRYKPVAKLSGKSGAKKGGAPGNEEPSYNFNNFSNSPYVPQTHITSYEETNKGKSRIKSFERKKNARKYAENQEAYLNSKHKLNEESARQNQIKTEKIIKISGLYENLLTKVEEIYRPNHIKKDSSGLSFYKLKIDRRNKFLILVVSENNSINHLSIFLTIDKKTLNYCAFRIKKDDKHAIILSTSNNLDEFIQKLKDALAVGATDFRELEINDNFYESFEEISIKGIIEIMKKPFWNQLLL